MRRAVDDLTYQINVALIAVRLMRLHHRLESGMPGEIRGALWVLREKRQKMLMELGAEFEAIGTLYDATHDDGLRAAALVRGEIDAYRQEVQELRAEFAGASNGGPPGPLPGTVPQAGTPASEALSDASATSPPAGADTRAITHSSLHPSQRPSTSQAFKS